MCTFTREGFACKRWKEALWKIINPSNYFCHKSHDSTTKAAHKVVKDVFPYHTILCKRKTKISFYKLIPHETLWKLVSITKAFAF